MVQSAELGEGPQTTGYRVVSRIPLRTQNGARGVTVLPREGGAGLLYAKDAAPAADLSWEEVCRMSRQGKGPTPAASPAVPGAVAQQAQQYLEQNIMAWMQPKPQGQQILSSTLSSFVTTGASGGQAPMSQKALQEHNLTQRSSPYSPVHSSVAGLPPSCSSIPHSLSFSGYSHHSLLQGTSFSSPCPSTFGAAQPSAAASFFARAAQRLNLSSKKRRRQHHHPDTELPPFLTNFAEILRLSPPPAPPALLRSLGRKDSFCIGKVKVMLRIKADSEEMNSSFLSVDGRKKQVTVYELSNGQSSTAEKRAGVSAPKMFAFDAIFPADDTQAEVCSGSLPEVIQAVVGGTDGCLFVYGHSKLGKTHTMVGKSDSPQDLGVMPCAISWLFRLIYEQRQKTGARFSVRVSALELSGRNEVLRDLLSEYAAGTEGSGTSPGVYLRDDPIFGAQLINQSELRAPTAEKAAYLLDAALAARNRDGEDEGRNSHFLFTLHLYQYRVEKQGKGGVAGGRSRLHLFDLGSCDKISTKPRDGGCLSLSALGNVILALFNGQKHVPYKESKLTQLLKEAMSSLTCRVAMIAHISSQPCHFSEILGTLQLASRVHRMRRKKIKYPNVPMETDEKGCVRPFVRMHAEDNVKSGSDPDYTSSSEQSCDTVIYVGHLTTHNERDFTDNEGPPPSLPIVPKPKLLQQANSKTATAEGGSSTLERKRKNSVSKGQPEETKKEDAGHSGTPVKKVEKSQSSKGSPMVSRHQPASTQTQGEASKSAQNSPMRKTKHSRTSSKQDQGTSVEQTGTLGKSKGAVKTTVMQSDETWIDGPRFVKPKFDSKTLHQLQKEQWVDGPPNVYGFMDHHKQDMIQRWIEEHSRQIQNAAKKKSNEVWIDYPSDKSAEKNASADASNKEASSASCKEKKTNDHSKTETQRGSSPSKTVPCTQEMIETDADSASNSADVDETDNEENAEASGYDSDMHILQIAQSDADSQALRESNYVETIEVYEPDEQVPMVDSCLQVNEEDILAEYWMLRHRKSSENPLPEVDQSSCDSNEHPLRILSEEDLNLPSSFADSRSGVSVDLDSISVPGEGFRDGGAVTWRLLYGNMFQRIKEQQQQRQRQGNGEDAETAKKINDKLERIAKLRELIQPLTRHRSQTKVDSIFKTCPVSRSGSRFTMPDMMDRSEESSVEDLSTAEVTSIHSEPADLDLEKFDYKLNIKPMNGLKLEAFYRKIQKVPPFLEQYSSLKPTQVVPPLSYEQEKLYLVNKLENQRSESESIINNIGGYKPNPNSSYYKLNVEGHSDIDERDLKDAISSMKQTCSSFSIHKPVSSSNLQKESAKFSSSENTIPTKIQRADLSAPSELDNKKPVEKREHKKDVLNDVSKRTTAESKSSSRTLAKNIDPSLLTVGQSPTISPKSRLHRSKMKNGTTDHPQSSSSSLWSKDSSSASSKTPRSSGRSNKCAGPKATRKQQVLPTRSSPTSSSTSGVTTTCCSGVVKSTGLKAGGSKASKQQCPPLCRSTSSPSTCVESGDTDFTTTEGCSGEYRLSPYAHHKGGRGGRPPQRTSSGHGSESSVNSSAKDRLLGKGGACCKTTQQFSGTSSGYESMLRDSEGTPLSSSQESGNEDSVGGERGRRGRRKSNGSSKRSSSAPARSPPSPLGPSPPVAAIHQQPLGGGGRSCRRGGDRSALHRSDEEVCCTSLLCCRLLDFY